jgi:hypothetical protein
MLIILPIATPPCTRQLSKTPDRLELVRRENTSAPACGASCDYSQARLVLATDGANGKSYLSVDVQELCPIRSVRLMATLKIFRASQWSRNLVQPVHCGPLYLDPPTACILQPNRVRAQPRKAALGEINVFAVSTTRPQLMSMALQEAFISQLYNSKP